MARYNQFEIVMALFGYKKLKILQIKNIYAINEKFSLILRLENI
jgi:hypothetical protein